MQEGQIVLAETNGQYSPKIPLGRVSAGISLVGITEEDYKATNDAHIAAWILFVIWNGPQCGLARIQCYPIESPVCAGKR